MEKKTLGTFLAALRKASGMTQKQLAEKLNVSDKAVSRWERDECAPDLSLIPVIAEIFGITSDELLRGERRAADAPQSPLDEKKTEKQVRHLLNSALSRFKIWSLISAAIALIGMVAAMACNLGFLRAYLGFFTGMAFYIAAGVCETIFLILSRSAVKDSDCPGDALGDYYRSILRAASLTYGTIFFLFAATLPLVLQSVGAYAGLLADSWRWYGVLYGSISIVISVLATWLAQARLERKGILVRSPADVHLAKLRKKTFRLAVILLAIVLALQWGINQFTSATTYVDGQTFHSLEDFKAFMETPSDSFSEEMRTAYRGGPNGSPDSETVYIDVDGTVLYPEEISEETLTGPEGEILCRYTPLNQSVAEIHYGDAEDGMLPITVYTFLERSEGARVLDTINIVFTFLYIALAVGVAGYYLYKRNKLR